MKLLYMERGKNRRKNCFHVFFVTLLLVFVSCKSNSYLNLLTGGSIRYWQLPEMRFYFSFDKRTHRRLEYDTLLNISYNNGLEVLSKGQCFKLKGNRVFLSWKVRGYTIPIDTFDILEISNQKLFIRWTDVNLAIYGHSCKYPWLIFVV